MQFSLVQGYYFSGEKCSAKLCKNAFSTHIEKCHCVNCFARPFVCTNVTLVRKTPGLEGLLLYKQYAIWHFKGIFSFPFNFCAFYATIHHNKVDRPRSCYYSIVCSSDYLNSSSCAKWAKKSVWCCKERLIIQKEFFHNARKRIKG